MLLEKIILKRSKKYTNAKKIKRAKRARVAVIMVAAMTLMTFAFQAMAAPGSTVYVSSSAELKSALENTSVDEIIFKNDIEASSAMKIAAKRTNSNLIIDGKGFTFTERHIKTYSACYGIYLTDTTTIDTITIQNMNIVGRNGYGTIYTTKGIKQVFKNVKYVGPQMVHNDNGSVRIEDSTIDIGAYNNNTYNGEVAEVNRVVLAGTVTITKAQDKDGCVDEIFWLKNTGAGIKMEDGANITVTNNDSSKSGFIYASAQYYFNIGNNVKFDYTGRYQFEETCTLKTFDMGVNSEFNVRLGNGLSDRVIRASDTVNVGDGSSVNITIEGDSSNYVIYAGKDMTFGAGSSVIIGTGNVKCSTVMHAGNNMTFDTDSKVIISIDGYLACSVMHAGKDMTFGKNSDASILMSGYLCGNVVYANKNILFDDGSDMDIKIGVVKSGYVMKSCSGDITVKDNASVSINTGSVSCGDVVTASCGSIAIGKNAKFIITMNGDLGCSVMYAYKNILIDESSDVSITMGNVKTGYVLKSCTGDITVKDNASVNINTGSVSCGYVVTANCGSISIGKNAEFIVNSNGAMKTALMWVKRNLTVGEGAVLDLIANKNSYTCCNYVLHIDGCAECYRSTITYNNPKRVLLYNDNTTSCKSTSYAAYLGCFTSVNINVYSTEYWNSAKKTGGVTVLDNADYKWTQDPIQHGSYNVSAVSTLNCKGFNKSFKCTNYVGDKHGSGKMDADKYYFGKISSCTTKNNYEVCLWNGLGTENPKTASLTYVFNNIAHTNYDGTPYSENASEAYDYTLGSAQAVKDLSEVFTDYYGHNGTCEFLGWSTQPDGTVEYAAGAAITVSADTTLYAIWKSCAPTVNNIYEYDANVSGSGVLYGSGAIGARIDVTLPDGEQITTTVISDGTWAIVVPTSSLGSMTAGKLVTTVQTENGKQASNPVTVTIQP